MFKSIPVASKENMLNSLFNVISNERRGSILASFAV